MVTGPTHKQRSAAGLAGAGTAPGVARLDLAIGDASSASCIVKLTSLPEVTAHRLVDAALPRMAPKFLQAVPLSDGDPRHARYLLVMEDCCAKQPATTLTALLARRHRRGTQTYLNAAIQQVAALHRRFETCAAELERRGIGPAVTSRVPDAHEVASVIERALRLSACGGGDEDLGAQCAAISQGMSDFFSRMRNKERHTLVHGDLHFDNILVTETDRLIMVDWGAVATANPCWDLVFFGPDELATYLYATGMRARRYREDFLEDHRAAVAVRMFDLLQAAMNLKRHRPSEVRSAVDVIIRNLARVAQRPYRGGIGFRAARRPPKTNRLRSLKI